MMGAGDHDPEGAPSGLHRSGIFWAGLASLTIAAALALLMLAGSGLGLGFSSRCNVTDADGILADVDPPHRSDFSYFEASEGATRAFPPGKECLLYGGTGSAGDPDGGYRLIGSRYYPEPGSYLWIPVLVLGPFAVLFAGRLVRRVARGTRRS